MCLPPEREKEGKKEGRSYRENNKRMNEGKKEKRTKEWTKEELVKERKKATERMNVMEAMMKNIRRRKPKEKPVICITAPVLWQITDNGGEQQVSDCKVMRTLNTRLTSPRDYHRTRGIHQWHGQDTRQVSAARSGHVPGYQTWTWMKQFPRFPTCQWSQKLPVHARLSPTWQLNGFSRYGPEKSRSIETEHSPWKATPYLCVGTHTYIYGPW